MKFCKPPFAVVGRWSVWILLGSGLIWGGVEARAQNPEAVSSRRIMAGDRLNISVREQPDMSTGVCGGGRWFDGLCLCWPGGHRRADFRRGGPANWNPSWKEIFQGSQCYDIHRQLCGRRCADDRCRQKSREPALSRRFNPDVDGGDFPERGAGEQRRRRPGAHLALGARGQHGAAEHRSERAGDAGYNGFFQGPVPPSARYHRGAESRGGGGAKRIPGVGRSGQGRVSSLSRKGWMSSRR